MQRNAILGGCAVVALGIAAYLTFSGFGRAKEIPTKYETYGVCLACKQENTVVHDSTDAAPFVCKQCKEQTVYPWLYCFNCNKRFVAQLVRPDPNGPLRANPFPACPICRKSRYAAYDPTEADQKPVGNAPLPKWKP